MEKKKLYFDLEWVPMAENLQALQIESPAHYEAWVNKCKRFRSSGKYTLVDSDSEIFSKEAGFFPEFINIIAASFGFFTTDGTFKVDSISGNSEVEILNNISILLSKTLGKYELCGHSIKRFDMPFLAKRMAINGIKVPYQLNNGNKKPWELTAIDIAELWGFGCNQEKFTSLDFMCASLGVPTSKDAISGADVAQAYWDGRISEIKEYCNKDVVATALVEQKISEVI